METSTHQQKEQVKQRKIIPTPRQAKAVIAVIKNEQSDNPLPMGQVLKSVGYGTGLQEQPHRVIESEGFQKLLAEKIPEDLVADTHIQLLKSTRLDHMIFPLGPKGEDDENFSGGTPNRGENKEEVAERTTLTDQEIIAMLAEVNCKVRRIVHGETARHVYFWAADNMARDKAVDKAYKLRGRYQADQEPPKSNIGNIYNVFFTPAVQADVKTLEDKIKQALIQKPNAQEIKETLESNEERS